MHFLFERFATAPDRIAFIDRDRRFTYGDILTMIGDHERRLAAGGVPERSVVAVAGDYSPEVFCFLMALARRGCVAVPVTPNTVVEQAAILALSEAEWIADCEGTTSVVRVTSTGRRATRPLLTGLLATGRPGLILFSSGSTGQSKAILHDLTRVAARFVRHGQPITAIAFLMLDHFGGINTLLAITSALGTVVTVADRSVAGICRAIQDHHVQVLPTTPSFLTMLVRSGMTGRFRLDSLTRITYGTEVMPQNTLDRVRELFPGVVLQQTYGLSELGVLGSKSREDGSLWVRLGGEGFRTKVVDDLLWVKSEYAMLGYLNAASPFDDDGWFNTQDRVEVDGDWFRILGRVTDLINVAGQKVYPAEVEDVILELDNIEDVAVYGEPSALLGQLVVAKVVTGSPEPVASLKQRIRLACRAKMAPYKVPAKVVIAQSGLQSARMKKQRGQAHHDS